MEGEIEIPLEAADIIIAGMKNFLDVLPGKELPEFIQIVEDKWIHEEVRRWAGKLDQAHPFVVGMQAVRFGIDRDGILGG